MVDDLSAAIGGPPAGYCQEIVELHRLSLDVSRTDVSMRCRSFGVADADCLAAATRLVVVCGARIHGDNSLVGACVVRPARRGSVIFNDVVGRVLGAIAEAVES